MTTMRDLLDAAVADGAKIAASRERIARSALQTQRRRAQPPEAAWHRVGRAGKNLARAVLRPARRALRHARDRKAPSGAGS